ncbi:urease accessory protein UreH domain-containing protein [Phytohabitans kaempferiae]|uniref:Sulfite exporter TauE/SafE family protein n=1 Tax=Phytohabitans kaempferiae TaxID=1620943 RepID=A0ABV6MC72_9ACTN
MKRRWLLALAAAPIALLLMPAAPASAHPLGNFSVNQYVGLTLRPDRIDATAVVDFAEIPTLQATAAPSCDDLAGSIALAVDDQPLQWTIGSAGFGYEEGTGGLRTSRLTCGLSAAAPLSTATVTVANGYAPDRIGWREMTARGDGVRVESPLPVESASDELRTYPADPLASAPDVRSATLRVTPGDGTAGAALSRPGDGFLAGVTAGVERHFQELAGGRLTPAVGLLAVLLALLLGAGHAALPGHGKTVLAAYAAARRRRIRDALAVGATVTLTHTGGVLVVGLLLATSSTLAGDRVLGYLGIVSGVIVVAVGVGMFVRRQRGHHHHHHGHSHDHAHPHSHGHGHGRLGLAGIGIAGGLVPSPSAIVVLLAAIGLGRTAFGVVLVLAYGVGMAATLTAVGLALVAAQRRLGRLPRLPRVAQRLTRAAPAGTAALVVLVGAGVAARAATGAF